MGGWFALLLWRVGRESKGKRGTNNILEKKAYGAEEEHCSLSRSRKGEEGERVEETKERARHR